MLETSARGYPPLNQEPTVAQTERRENHGLRRQVDCLLGAGASLTGRDPISIAFHDCTITVRNGKLFSENGLRGLVAVIAEHVWPCRESRNPAIDICLGQLDTCKDELARPGEPKRSPSEQR